MTEQNTNERAAGAAASVDERFKALMAIRAEKWDRIKHLDGHDGELLKVYVSFVGAVGALVVWLASRQQPCALGHSAACELGMRHFLAVGFVFVCLSAYGIAAVLRNYVNYLRALVVIGGLEQDLRRMGLPFAIHSLQFRAPATVWDFVGKLVRTTRGPLLAIYLSSTPALASAVAAFNPAARYTAWLFLLISAGFTALMVVVHWRSFDRVDSAGFVVLAEAPAPTAEGPHLVVAMLLSHDGKWGHPKGHRKARRFRPREAAADTRWRELQEELRLWRSDGKLWQETLPLQPEVRNREPVGIATWHQMARAGQIVTSRYHLDTYPDPEPESWRGDKAVRLWALLFRRGSLECPPRPGLTFVTNKDEHAEGAWRSVKEVLEEPAHLHRAPYVKQALRAACSAIGRQRDLAR